MIDGAGRLGRRRRGLMAGLYLVLGGTTVATGMASPYQR